MINKKICIKNNLKPESVAKRKKIEKFTGKRKLRE